MILNEFNVRSSKLWMRINLKLSDPMTSNLLSRAKITLELTYGIKIEYCY